MASPLKGAIDRTAKKSPQGSASKFAAAISGARVFHPFVIPRLDYPAVMTLLPWSQKKVIESEVYAEMKRLGLEINVYGRSAEDVYERDRACRTLAAVVGEAEPGSRREFVPVGSMEDWALIDDPILEDCWRTYGDVRAAADPVEYPLDREEFEAVMLAVKKKQETVLRFLGTRRLASFLLSMGDQLSTSPLPTSSSGPSSPGGSIPITTLPGSGE